MRFALTFVVIAGISSPAVAQSAEDLSAMTMPELVELAGKQCVDACTELARGTSPSLAAENLERTRLVAREKGNGTAPAIITSLAAIPSRETAQADAAPMEQKSRIGSQCANKCADAKHSAPKAAAQ